MTAAGRNGGSATTGWRRPDGRSFGIPDDDDLPSARLWPSLLELAYGNGIVDSADLEPDCAFLRLYAPVASGFGASSFVIGQLGQSLDGRIATATGRSHHIGGPEAIRHVHRLRALVDAVVIGVGTAIADDPLLTVRHVHGRNPARVVIDPNFRLPESARMLADGAAPVLAIQSCDRPRAGRVIPVVVPLRAGLLDPAGIVAALAGHGYRRILVEGGACTLSAFLAAGMVDRLHIAVTPMLIGSGPVGISLPPIDRLDDALRPGSTDIHRLGRDILFDCCLTRRAVRPEAQQELCDAGGGVFPAR